jgi:hypothetical protein
MTRSARRFTSVLVRRLTVVSAGFSCALGCSSAALMPNPDASAGASGTIGTGGQGPGAGAGEGGTGGGGASTGGASGGGVSTGGAGAGGAGGAAGSSAGRACVLPPIVRDDRRAAWALALGNGTAAGAVVTPSGQIVVAGSFLTDLKVGAKTFTANSGTGDNAFALALDGEGRLAWERTFPSHWTPLALGVDAVGDLIVLGDVPPISQPAPIDLGKGAVAGPLLLAKLDPSGNTVWSRGGDGLLSGATSLDMAALAVDADGRIGILGVSYNPYPTAQSFVALLDPSGALLWTRPVAEGLTPKGIVFDADGNLVFGGYYTGRILLDASLPPATLPTGFVAVADATGVVFSLRELSPASKITALATTASRVLLGGTFNGDMTVDLQTFTSRGLGDLFVASLAEIGPAAGAPVVETVPAGLDRWDAILPRSAGGAFLLGDVGDYVDLGDGLLTPTGLVLASLDGTGALSTSIAFDAPYGAHGHTLVGGPDGSLVAFGGFDRLIDLGTGPLKGYQSFEDTLFVAKYVPAAVTPAPGPRTVCPPAVAGSILSSPDPNIGGLLLRGTTLYYTTGTEIMSVPLAGGAPTVLARTQRYAGALVADDRALYWASYGTPFEDGVGHDGAISSMPLAGGPVTVLADHLDYPTALAIDDTSAYWSWTPSPLSSTPPTEGQLLSVPKSGGAPVVLAKGLAYPRAVAVGGGSVVVASGSDPTVPGGQLMRVSLVNGATEVLVTSDRHVSGLAIDGTTVFFTESDSPTVDVSADDGRVRSVPLAGGAITTIAEGRLSPGSPVVVGDTLIWGEAGTMHLLPGNDGSVTSVPKAGGTLTTLVSGITALGSFAVDAAHVVWVQGVDSSGGWALEAKSR